MSRRFFENESIFSMTCSAEKFIGKCKGLDVVIDSNFFDQFESRFCIHEALEFHYGVGETNRLFLVLGAEEREDAFIEMSIVDSAIDVNSHPSKIIMRSFYFPQKNTMLIDKLYLDSSKTLPQNKGYASLLLYNIDYVLANISNEPTIVFHNFISFLNAWSIASLKSL